ncbi:serine/threonine-protein kinase, partial [Streptomyces alkaliphilus]|uniref:serine/threonine-protein kinase n=1 Tax=Streptomyces alkaliphilus TaxID=1472722 RepID=UPI00117F53F5
MEPLSAGDPRRMGGYRLLRRLGSGGMGVVYLGRSPGGRTVAVKAVHARFARDPSFRARFAREVAAARRVGGAWTAPVLDADPGAEVPWVATGYVAGPDLQRTVDGTGPLPLHSVRALGAGTAEALAAVHALGLVHRDIKPSNVLLTLDGPRLIDFGIARATDVGTDVEGGAITDTGMSVGSPGYMSPEQILGEEVGPATDVFALGAVLALASGGRPPFVAEGAAQLLYRMVHGEPDLDAVPEALREPVRRCLAKDPADRPDPADLARELSGGRGAAELVREGWLPHAVVEGVSRRAVLLLNLEAGTDGAGWSTGAAAPATDADAEAGGNGTAGAEEITAAGVSPAPDDPDTTDTEPRNGAPAPAPGSAEPAPTPVSMRAEANRRGPASVSCVVSTAQR